MIVSSNEFKLYFFFSLFTGHAEEVAAEHRVQRPAGHRRESRQVLAPLHPRGPRLARGRAPDGLPDLPDALHWICVLNPVAPSQRLFDVGLLRVLRSL